MSETPRTNAMKSKECPMGTAEAYIDARDLASQLERDLTAARAGAAALKAENDRLVSDAKEKSAIHIATLHDQAQEKIYYARVNAQLQKDNERLVKDRDVWVGRLNAMERRAIDAEVLLETKNMHINNLTKECSEARAHAAQSAKAQEGKDKANG